MGGSIYIMDTFDPIRIRLGIIRRLMDRSNAMRILCIATAMGIAPYIFDAILDSLANASPLYRATVYYFLLSFILVVLVFAPQAYIRRPGTFIWDSRFRSLEEAFDYLKFALFWWLILSNLAVMFEAFVVGICEVSFRMGWRQEDPDDPDHIPLLLRLNWANISWMGSTVGEWLWWHVEYYRSELEAFLEQLLR
ncbi:hypothetical protein ACHAPE_000897 [Trichoderma viride]